ncbi:hypothetical protein ACFVZD_34875 [Streptomyces sp. NPDC058287]|uniref:hypothetical protein n=1 Tax=unclassified Streptomyces TaxID=2593676 RepID=UPI0036E2F783
MRNHEYSILKSFADLEETPGVPRLDLPGLGISSLARGFGCRAVELTNTADFEGQFQAPIDSDTPTVVVVHPAREDRALSRVQSR